MRTVLGIGNCQVHGMIQAASAMLGLTPLYLHPDAVSQTPELLKDALPSAAIVFARADKVEGVEELARLIGRPELPVIPAPRLHFSGFHPDVVTPLKMAGKFRLPMGNTNSAILLAASRDGLSEADALTLFRDDVYDALGYYDAFGVASELLLDECRQAGFDAGPLIRRWMDDGPFFYVPLHPKIAVLKDIAFTQLRRFGLCDDSFQDAAIVDDLSWNLIWPVYPEIAERLGMAGDYIFRPRKKPGKEARAPAPMDLETFVQRTFACYRQSPPDLSHYPRMADPRYESLQRFVKRRAAASAANPYKELPAANWWSKSVAGLPEVEVDPVYRAKFKISRKDRIATAGSCFAQHIARKLERAGFNYLVTEPAPPNCTDPAAEDYATFTARFGNIYTVRQLLQLADRAYGKFEPAIDAWELPGGAGYLDPFRPRVGSRPFTSPDELRAARDVHLAAVREMFETADLFVFTLGLTECWWSREDQAVVPLPPGIVGAELPAGTYEPKNFTVVEVLTDLQRLLGFFQEVNPTVRIVLTVSPVPLVATFEKDHVLAATTYSKSVLRAAAGEIASANAHVAYFPSYEIITGSFNRGRYFAEDLRQVTSAGVDHVMRSFLLHYGAESDLSLVRPASDTERLKAEIAAAMDIVCDEEEIQGDAKLPSTELRDKRRRVGKA